MHIISVTWGFDFIWLTVVAHVEGGQANIGVA